MQPLARAHAPQRAVLFGSDPGVGAGSGLGAPEAKSAQPGAGSPAHGSAWRAPPAAEPRAGLGSARGERPRARPGLGRAPRPSLSPLPPIPVAPATPPAAAPALPGSAPPQVAALGRRRPAPGRGPRICPVIADVAEARAPIGRRRPAGANPGANPGRNLGAALGGAGRPRGWEATRNRPPRESGVPRPAFAARSAAVRTRSPVDAQRPP